MPKRTKTREPGIYSVERADGGKSYEVAYRNAEGRSRTKTFRNFNAARDFKRRSHHEVKQGTYVDPAAGRATLSDYYADFRSRQLWDESTLDGTDRAIRDCTFSQMPLGKIKATHVEEWVKSLSERLAPSTVQTTFLRVSTVVKGAVRDKHLAQNPLEGVVLPRQSNEELHIPRPETIASILEAAEDHWRTAWALCAFAGLRRGEVAGLKVSDIRFSERRLRVDRQVQQLRGGELRVKPPKYGSNRTVYIPDDLVKMLSGHLEAGVNGDWLFMGRKSGDPPHPNTLDHQWRKTLGAAGVQHFGIHDLRHFFASGLIAGGEDVVKVQRQLGHKNATVTLNTYSHLWPDAEETTRAAAAGVMAQVVPPHVGKALG